MSSNSSQRPRPSTEQRGRFTSLSQAPSYQARAVGLSSIYAKGETVT